ncbi:MAG: TIM barrel protein [Acidobacteriaceae bacterium]
MRLQHFEEKNRQIRQRFSELKKASPDKLRARLNLSWSNWGFGRESLSDSAKRLRKAGLSFIELHGDHYGTDLGYKADETMKILADHGLRVSGVCGMFSADNDLSSNRAVCRQAAVDYLRREIPFTTEVGGSYLLVVPGAVGRPKAYDDVEMDRSAETLAMCGDWFLEHGINAAIEPIRAAETSLVHTVAEARIHSTAYVHPWSTLGSFSGNPMGVNWTGVLFGLGGVIAFGYWTTDFLVVQRAMAAKDLRSAKMAPILASYFKMLMPLIVILPGLLAIAVLPFKLVPETVVQPGQYSYNAVLPLMLARYCGPGLLGLGVTALIAGFMSGMAGNVSAFATVWTCDIYQPYIRKSETDAHYVRVGRWCTILGVILSIVTAYFVTQFKSIMDYMQALVSFFIAPLFGTVIIGMFWKRATPKAGFWGLLAGTVSSIAMYALVKANPSYLAIVALSSDAKAMAENLYRALWSWLICVLVTVVVSLFTTRKPPDQLKNLVYGYTEIPSDKGLPLYQRPIFWAAGVAVFFAVLQWIFW